MMSSDVEAGESSAHDRPDMTAAPTAERTVLLRRSLRLSIRRLLDWINKLIRVGSSLVKRTSMTHPEGTTDHVDPSDSTESAASEYVVVMRSRSAARFPPDEVWQVNGRIEGLPDPVRMSVFTRWVDSEAGSLPRELVVEIRGRAPTLDYAIVKFAGIGWLVATMVGFVANVRVGPLEVHLAYDATPDHTERQFVEAFLPDERGLVSEGSIIRQNLLAGVFAAYLALQADRPRIERALRQYELALREWCVGGEWLALSHLYMAVEALTPAVIRKAQDRRGLSKEELAQTLGVDPYDPKRPRWQKALDEYARKLLIFDGDLDTYRAALDASNGLEHGFMELDEIAKRALKCTDKTFHYVRRTIADLLDLPTDIFDGVVSIKPIDVQSRRKVIRGSLIGAADDPAAEGQQYPLLEWNSGVDYLVRDGFSFKIQEKETVTVRAHPDISFRPERIELHGRVEDGQAPIEISQEEIAIDYEPEPKSKLMLSEVMPLIDLATESGRETGRTWLQMIAFNWFGMGVAFFQSAHNLIANGQPVEALLPLRGLVMVASRFEQMTQVDGAGLGIAVRWAIDTLDKMDETELDSVIISSNRERLLEVANANDLTVPDKLPEIDEGQLYGNFMTEIEMAQRVIDVTYTSVALHIKTVDGEYKGFDTTVAPGAFTELIASSTVMAQLELLKSGARVFNWVIDVAKFDELIGRARELYEVTVFPEPDGSGTGSGV
jgi:hypothetical protein